MKINRQEVYDKFGWLCAYSGTPLKYDWQVDHLIPKCQVRNYFNHDDIQNLMPTQRIVNHYKRSLSLEEFRGWYLGGLHERLRRLPKKTTNPRQLNGKGILWKLLNSLE